MNQIRSIIDRTPDPSASIRSLTSDIPTTAVHFVQNPTYRTLSLIQNQLDHFHSTDNNKTSTNFYENRPLFQFRFIQLVDLQSEGILPRQLTVEQQTRLQKLDSQVATLPVDKQRQFIQTQRIFVPKYLAATAQNQLPTLKRSRTEIIDQQIRKEHSIILHPNTKRRFVTRRDAIESLLPFHHFAHPQTSKNDCEKFDELFEKEAKRLLNSTERIQQSIDRIALANDPQTINTNVYDQYLLEKIQLDELREEVETRKRLKSNSFESSSFRCEPVMSDEAYFDLFQSQG